MSGATTTAPNDLVAGLGLIDFVGDRLTIDMDSLSVLNGQFAGTTIDIDFAGGKDVDLGAIIGIVIPSPLAILNDQVLLAGTGASGTLQHAADHPQQFRHRRRRRRRYE